MKYVMALVAATAALRPISEALMQTRFAEEITDKSDFDEISQLSQHKVWEGLVDGHEKHDYLYEAPGNRVQRVEDVEDIQVDAQ